jgi:hypothetical protein
MTIGVKYEVNVKVNTPSWILIVPIVTETTVHR